MKIAIRRAVILDVPLIYNMLYFGALDSYPGSEGFDPDKAEQTIQNLIPTSLVAVDGEDLVGALMMTIDQPWYSTSKFMRDIVFFVREDARASTAAIRLMKSAIRSAQKAQLPLVLQHISGTDILRKDRFYERNGGRRLGSIFIFEG